jgi:hypothetical protein
LTNKYAYLRTNFKKMIKKTYQLLALSIFGLGNVSQGQVTQTFTYTGSAQTFTVPSCVSQLTITAYGASGADGQGSSTGSSGGMGASGAVVTGTFAVTSGTVMNIYVGGAGSLTSGGFNGGGAGGNDGAGGGGASDVRVNGIALTDRILVAGGGGAGGNGGCYGTNNFAGNGGVGGNGNGTSGTNTVGGGGGAGGVGSTGGAGGIGCFCCLGANGTNGLAGIGGTGGTGTNICSTILSSGGGGGGGYLGGGAGGGGSAGTTGCSLNDTGAGAGGAGGSNYTDPTMTAVSESNGTAPVGNGTVVITYTVNTIPTVLATVGDTRCGTGTVSVSATASIGTIDWYISPSGGSALASGATSYSTSISATTIFYAEANNMGCLSTSRSAATAIVNDNTASDTLATACNSFNWYGTDYTATGTATHTLTNASGCDSIVTLHLTINTSNSGDTTATACDSFNWYGTDYTATGTATHTLTNAAGCDSIVTLNLTINTSNSGDTTATACDSFNWYGTDYTATGTATHTLTNAVGCDSIVTLHLTISTIDLSVTNLIDSLSANQSLGTYQWIDCDNNNAILNGETNQWYNPAQNGNYAVIVTKGICSDTSACQAVTSLGVPSNAFGNSDISVYPNPTNGQFSINLSTAKVVTVCVVNAVGKEIVRTNHHDSFITIDIRDQANGIYLLQIQTESGIFQQRIIKQ